MKAAVFTVAILAQPMQAITAPAPPKAIQSQLPQGYDVLAEAETMVGEPARSFIILALGRHDEDKAQNASNDAPERPLMIFETDGAKARLVARNDTVVSRADQGGQCDPFLDGGGVIAVKGVYFTVQNGVACGAHWTDYITFRFDEGAGGFVFDNERSESWKMNPSTDPNAEALIRDGRQNIRRDHKGHITPFAAWRPAP